MEDVMEDLKECRVSCYWTYRFELLGLVLIFIATILTIVTFNSLGIAAMFVVGAALCCHKYLSCNSCNVCHPDYTIEEETTLSLEPEPKPIKRTIKTPKI
jgi:hypothetical protein